ncbi:peptidoglycan-associated lipoprotein Pal [Shewanella sp. YIC-542]|uniref:peptidoglycan-associated lipoprotein Pal n=1 Tax=Shewanella mytili TaxID=3377111 RepID=UPI00398ED35B
MELKKLLKAMAISLPLLALGACSSTSESETAAGAGNTSGSGAYGTAGGVEMGGAAQVLTPEEQQRLKFQELRKDSVIYFDFDRSEIRQEVAEILQAHGEYLVSHPSVKVLIEGHTDDRGTPEYNIALGERRAKAVAKYLQGLGVLPSQMSIVSYGEEKPADLSHTDEGQAMNRRAVLVY